MKLNPHNHNAVARLRKPKTSNFRQPGVGLFPPSFSSLSSVQKLVPDKEMTHAETRGTRSKASDSIPLRTSVPPREAQTPLSPLPPAQIQTPPFHSDLRAFTIWDALLFLVGLLIIAAIFLPAFVPNRPRHGVWQCVNNLKQIGMGFRIWAGDNDGHYPMQVYTNHSGGPLFTTTNDIFRYFQVMSNELSTPRVLICPFENRRTATNFNNDFNSQKVGYFIGLDAIPSGTNMFLAGDRLLSNGRPLSQAEWR